MRKSLPVKIRCRTRLFLHISQLSFSRKEDPPVAPRSNTEWESQKIFRAVGVGRMWEGWFGALLGPNSRAYHIRWEIIRKHDRQAGGGLIRSEIVPCSCTILYSWHWVVMPAASLLTYRFSTPGPYSLSSIPTRILILTKSQASGHIHSPPFQKRKLPPRINYKPKNVETKREKRRKKKTRKRPIELSSQKALLEEINLKPPKTPTLRSVVKANDDTGRGKKSQQTSY